MLSRMVEPPKPRLITVRSGKSFSSVFHMRMLELPTNRTASRGGIRLASAASKARISCSNGGSFFCCCCATMGAETKTMIATNGSESRYAMSADLTSGGGGPSVRLVQHAHEPRSDAVEVLREHL